VDAARYFILHKYGGVYADLDILPTRDISPLLQYVDVVLPVTPNVGLTNAFLASAKGSDFFDYLIHRLAGAQHHWYNPFSRHLRVITGAGPYFLWGNFNEYNRERGPAHLGDDPFPAGQANPPSRIGLLPNWIWGKCSMCQDSCKKRILPSGKVIDVHPFMSHLHGDSWHSFDSWVWSYVVQCYTSYIVVGSGLLLVILLNSLGNLINKLFPPKGTANELPSYHTGTLSTRGPNLLCRRHGRALAMLAVLACMQALVAPTGAIGVIGGGTAAGAQRGIGFMPTVYQSWETKTLSSQAQSWQATWTGLGFTVHLADRAERRETLRELSETIHDTKVQGAPKSTQPHLALPLARVALLAWVGTRGHMVNASKHTVVRMDGSPNCMRLPHWDVFLRRHWLLAGN